MNGQYPVPILFLIFNRPDTTQQVFDQIKKVRPKILYVAADGPRKNVNGELEKINITRNIINQIDWNCEVKTLFRRENLGCKYAVSSAITWFFDNVEEGIILEDDCYPDLSFFKFCGILLEKYRNIEEVAFIGGNCFQKNKRNERNASYYFSHYPHIWGWATWRRVWDKYDVDMKGYELNKFNEDFEHIFNSRAEKKYWKKIYNRIYLGQVNTWDYQFTFSMWKNAGIAITPTKNLVINLGFQNNSTHFFLEDSYQTGLKCETMNFPLIIPKDYSIDKKSDIFTFDSLYSHSFKRALRLFKENKISNIKKYIFRNH